MSLYEYTDLTVGTSAVSLPSESITFNGHKLDSELVGYQTLNVEGRSSFTRSLSTATGLADGDLFLSSRIESNKISVKYMVSRSEERFSRNAETDLLLASRMPSSA